MVSIFVRKSERKELHLLTVKELEAVSQGLSSLFHCGKEKFAVVGARVWVVGESGCD